jgi:hypothetical protein
MRKLGLRIALHGLLLMLLALAPAAHAQEGEGPDFKMPCEEALKLGLDKFMNVYGEKTTDYSPAGQKQGFEYWVNCKRPANDALAARSLSEERRKQFEAAREEFNKFGTALWGLKYLEEGGGTMWGLISVGSYAEREKFMETFIRTLAAPERRSPRARRRANASLARIQRWLAAADRKPFTEGSEPEQVEQNKKYYAETIKDTRDALAKLRDLLKELPDDAADRLAAKMASETRNALADTP